MRAIHSHMDMIFYLQL